MSVYLCGGINGLSDSDCKNWRETAKSLLLADTLDPMRRDYRGREDDCVDEIVDSDIEDISACSAVLVNASRPSWGTAMELVYAKQAGKPIVAFGVDSRVSPWLRRHSTVIVERLEIACERVNEILHRTPSA